MIRDSAIRPAGTRHCAAIAAIWNPVIRDTLVTFTDREKTPEALLQMLSETRAAGHGFLVAEGPGGLLGFAAYGQFRGGPGYRQAMEHTIMLAPAARGQGLGRALMARLEEHARDGGAHVMLAGVSSANPEGRAFHEAIGYRVVGVLPEVGRKFGRWLDLVLMHKSL